MSRVRLIAFAIYALFCVVATVLSLMGGHTTESKLSAGEFAWTAFCFAVMAALERNPENPMRLHFKGIALISGLAMMWISKAYLGHFQLFPAFTLIIAPGVIQAAPATTTRPRPQ